VLTLYRHRHEILWTNTELFLLRGASNPLAWVGIESLVGSQEWFSQVLIPNNFGVSAMGQASLSSRGARLNWLLSTQKTGSDPLPELIEHMGLEAGARGAHFMTAGARVDDCLFETLRRSGYCIYCWQIIWRIQPELAEYKSDSPIRWRQASPADAIRIDILQRKLLAPAVKSVTEFAGTRLPDLLLEDGKEVLGYAYKSRSNGIAVIKPFLRLDVENPEEALRRLISQYLSDAKSVFLVQTSDQSWLTESLLNLGEQALPREELLVKHFAVMEKQSVAQLNKAQNGVQADTVRPLIPSSRNKNHLS
jgi:hypothetical protein